ncbi:MAG: LamG-like jellyroll fold domain-containing protein [Bacteroides sp.]|jgi:hypothetical protein|nr:LamG-like jellyroll fold domain-containing protein [Bacteroides sp.]
MKRKIIFIVSTLLMAALIIGVTNCKKDEDEQVTFTLSSLKAGSIDMNGATPPDNIPPDPTITAVFSVDVKASTANENNIKLDRDYDGASIDLTITVSGRTVTIVPDVDLGNGALYKLTMSGIQSTDDQAIGTLERTFTTEGTFVPAGQIAHWGFEDNSNDDVGTYNPLPTGIIDITYVDSRNAEAGKAASFNGTTSIIEIPNGDELINTADFTITFWVKTNSENKTTGHFVMGLGAFYGIQYEIFGSYDGAKFAIQYEAGDGTTTAEDMWFPFEAQDNTNGGWQGWDFAKSISQDDMIALLKDAWLHVVYTYNGATKQGTLYYNGEKMKSFDFNLWPDGDLKQTIVGLKYGGTEPEVVNELAFGFIQSRAGTLWDNEPWGGYDFPDANHFKGLLDDIRFYHKVLTPTEISLMYESEKP